jgi:hypothetical protein
MNESLNISADFASVADALEPVTFHRRGSGGPAGHAIAHALRQQVTVREAVASGGRYTATDVTWHLPTSELPTAPRLGDVVCDAEGGRWTVLEVAPATLGSRWRLTARSLAIVYGLDDTITVLQASYVKGDCGAVEATWWPSRTGVRARIQPVAAKNSVQLEVRQTTTQYQIFVEEPLALDASHRIQSSNGTVYKILGVTAAERIGELEQIEAEVTPWP